MKILIFTAFLLCVLAKQCPVYNCDVISGNEGKHASEFVCAKLNSDGSISMNDCPDEDYYCFLPNAPITKQICQRRQESRDI
jgi:hypothetical protein